MTPFATATQGVPDVGDPIVVIIAIALTEALKRLLPAAMLGKLKPYLPALVVLTALAGRVIYDALATADGVTWETAFRALAAAGVAVLSHAQFRSVLKAVQAAQVAQDADPADQSE